ncbi:transposable element Tc1 transposase [Trichonephila clavipes]|nr:transposable element Tc1 transposase [Trichonephila clavipes]
MDDNATCHRTLAVQDCQDSEGIQCLVWPARCSDLNPIENVWDALGRQVAGRSYPPTNKNTLIRALTEEWDKLPQQLLDNVVQRWYKSDIIRFRIRIDYNLLFRINELHLLNADSKYRIWWISESPSSRAQIGRTTILLIDLRVSPDPVCRMATLLVPSVPGMSFSILAMGQERGGLLSSDIRTRLPTCTSDWEAFHLGLDW